MEMICRQPPDSGLMSDLLWSDPQPELGRAPSKRGVGLGFGPDITQKFLQKNKLQLLVRSHEVRALCSQLLLPLQTLSCECWIVKWTW